MTEETQSRHFSVNQAEKLLRGIETTEGILNEMKRIEVFKGTDALKYLMNTKKLLSIEAKDIMSVLLDNHYIVRVRRANDQYILDISYEFNINHEYIWLKEGSKAFMMLVSIAALVFAVALALFPIWPRTMRVGTGYFFYLLMGIVIFLISITIIRFILYVAVLLCTSKTFWLFPNLYAECGILESFVPLYGWDDEGPGIIDSLHSVLKKEMNKEK